MSKRFFVIASLVFAPLVACGCSKQSVGPPEDFTKDFQGTWQSIAPTKKEHSAMIKFENDVFYFVEQGAGPSSGGGKTTVGGAPGGPMPRGEQGKFNVNTATTPKSIDLSISDGPHAGKLRLGIYEFEGKHLKICLADYGESRPADFGAGGKAAFLTLDRKPDVPAAPITP